MGLLNSYEIRIFNTETKNFSMRMGQILSLFLCKGAKHNNCRLLCLLPVTLKVIVANSVDPDQTAPLGAV